MKFGRALAAALTASAFGAGTAMAAGDDNKRGNKIVQEVTDGLVAQGKAAEAAMAPLGRKGIEFGGSDSLDEPSKVFKK